MAVILITFNFVSDTVKFRVDLTKEKAYTLSPGTRAILGKLDTPVKVRFYCTQAEQATQETVMLRDYARRVEDLLDEYRRASGNKVVLEKYDPQPDSDAEDSARLDGIEGQQLSNGEKFYLGLAVSQLDAKEAIPFLAPEREQLLEYDLSRAITRVTRPEKPVIGIMSPLPVFGAPANPMMMQMGQQGQPPWTLVTELQNDFNVKRVEMDTDRIDDDIKLLVVIHPRDISDKAQYAVDQFVLRGGKVLAFLDPLPLLDSGERNPVLGNMPNHGSSLDKLLKAWGLQFDTAKVVADMNFLSQIPGRDGQPSDAPAVLSITSDGVDDKDIITGQIDSLLLPYAGAFTGTPVAGLKETVLLHSTADSQLVDGMMANISGENTEKDFKRSGVEYALAVRLTGKFKTAFPNGKPAEEKKDQTAEKPADSKPDSPLKESQQETTVVLVGDSDMLYDDVALRQVRTLVGSFVEPRNGNLDLAQNAIEQLTGDDNLISIRSRAALSHPFTVVRKMQAQAQEEYQSKIKELEQSLADTEQRLNELQQAKQGNQRFILSPEQQAEIENFRKTEAQAKIQLKDERKKLRRDIDSLENRLKWINIAAVPALVSLSGVGLAFYKRKRTAAK